MNIPFLASVNESSIVTNGLVLNLDAGNPKSIYNGQTVWRDISGNNYSGSLTGSVLPNYNYGNGGIINFSGNGVNIGNWINTPINLNWSMGTISCWVNPSSTSINFFSYTNFAETTPPFSSHTHELGITSLSKLNIYIYDGSAESIQGNTITLNNWYNAVFYWIDNNSFGAYLNGVFQNSRSVGTSWKTGTRFTIGNSVVAGNNPAYYYTGSIANVSIYNRVLSPQEVLQNYNATKGRFGL